jgi:hypothetical protein
MKQKREILIFSIFISIFLISLISADPINDSLHLNIQTTSGGLIQAGIFDFTFNISNLSDCSNSLYGINFNSVTTDSRGIVNFYLDNTNLDYSEQYYLNYLRNGVQKNCSKIARIPTAFRARNISSQGISWDNNINLGVYNITSPWGFFNSLNISGQIIGPGSNFAQYQFTNNNFNGSGNFTTTGYAQYQWSDVLENLTFIGNPPANTLRLYVEDNHGFSVYKYLDSTGMKRELVRDSVFIVKNIRGTTIAKHRIVYASGSSGDAPTIDLADASNLSEMASICVTVEQITNGSYGRWLEIFFMFQILLQELQQLLLH